MKCLVYIQFVKKTDRGTRLDSGWANGDETTKYRNCAATYDLKHKLDVQGIIEQLNQPETLFIRLEKP